MPSRAELETRAAGVSVTAANYPNDSKLEQAVIYAEKTRTPGTAEVKAVKTLTLSGNAVAGETITIGGRVYTFVASADLDNATANQIAIGAAATNTLDNIKSAIVADEAGRGTLYSQGTTKNPQVYVSSKTATTVVITANEAGASGTNIDTAETMTNGAWANTTAGVTGTAPTERSKAAISGGANV